MMDAPETAPWTPLNTFFREPVLSYQGRRVPDRFYDEVKRLADSDQPFISTKDQALKDWLNQVEAEIIEEKGRVAQRLEGHMRKSGKQRIDKKAYRKARNKHKKNRK